MFHRHYGCMKLKSMTCVAMSAVIAGGSALADVLHIHQNDAVQIVFQTDLRTDVNYPGDRFSAKVEHDPLLPDGTLLFGQIMRVHPATPYRAASMDLQFESLRLPDGERRWIQAVPAPLNDPHLRRGTDGHLVASYKPGDSAAYVFGGTVGGLIIGGIAHRPILGGLIGGLIGSIAGHEDRRQNANLIIHSGEKMAAVFEQDVAPNPGGPATAPPPSNGPSGWRTHEGRSAPPPAAPGSGTPPPPPPPASPQGDVIRLGDTPLNYSTVAPFHDGGVVMVPLQATADQMNVDVLEHANGTISLDSPDSSMMVTNGESSYSLNGHQGSLPHSVVEKNGVTYVPLNVFAALTSQKLTVNGTGVTWGQ